MFIIKDEANVNKFNYWLCGNGCRYWRRAGSVPGAVIGGAVGTIVGIW